MGYASDELDGVDRDAGLRLALPGPDCARDHNDGPRALDLSSEDQQLLTQEHVFGEQESARSEQVGNQTKDWRDGVAECGADVAQRAPGRGSHAGHQTLQHASSMPAFRRRDKLVIPQN